MNPEESQRLEESQRFFRNGPRPGNACGEALPGALRSSLPQENPGHGKSLAGPCPGAGAAASCPAAASQTHAGLLSSPPLLLPEFEVNIVVLLHDDHLITENFPLKLCRM